MNFFLQTDVLNSWKWQRSTWNILFCLIVVILQCVFFLQNLHNKHCHQGVQYLRVLSREKFAISKLRTTLMTIQSKCAICRKRKAAALSPMMTGLPKKNLLFRYPPLTNAGLDYFDPFYVSVKRSIGKCWRFLFTCLTTRAVHFEVAPPDEAFHPVSGPTTGWTFFAIQKQLLNPQVEAASFDSNSGWKVYHVEIQPTECTNQGSTNISQTQSFDWKQIINKMF